MLAWIAEEAAGSAAENAAPAAAHGGSHPTHPTHPAAHGSSQSAAAPAASHAAAHAAGHAASHAVGATGAGSVVLELGGEIGALVLYTPARMHGTEIEISPESHGPDGPRTHSLVRERITAAGTGYAAVYPEVPAGHYTVWGEDGVPVGTTLISGGQVTSFHWPG